MHVAHARGRWSMARRHVAQLGLGTSPRAARARGSDAHAYPRPMLRRGAWTNLNGPWDFALDPCCAWKTPDDVEFDRRIVVPFTPETPRSGVNETGLFKACWYRRA